MDINQLLLMLKKTGITASECVIKINGETGYVIEGDSGEQMLFTRDGLVRYAAEHGVSHENEHAI